MSYTASVHTQCIFCLLADLDRFNIATMQTYSGDIQQGGQFSIYISISVVSITRSGKHKLLSPIDIMPVMNLVLNHSVSCSTWLIFSYKIQLLTCQLCSKSHLKCTLIWEISVWCLADEFKNQLCPLTTLMAPHSYHTRFKL